MVQNVILSAILTTTQADIALALSSNFAKQMNIKVSDISHNDGKTKYDIIINRQNASIVKKFLDKAGLHVINQKQHSE